MYEHNALGYRSEAVERAVLRQLLFLFLLQNIDCGYWLELPRRGSSNVYPQSMF